MTDGGRRSIMATEQTARHTGRFTRSRRDRPELGPCDLTRRMARLPRLFVAVCGGRTLDPRVANPNVEGRPRPVGFLTGFDHWQVIPQIGALIMVVVLTIVFIRGWRKEPRQPCAADGLGYDADRMAGPDHELVAVRGCTTPTLLHWPESWPLIMMSPTVEALHRVRIRDVLLRPVLPGNLDPASRCRRKRGPKRSSPGTR